MKHYKKIELGKIAMLTFAGIINAIGITPDNFSLSLSVIAKYSSFLVWSEKTGEIVYRLCNICCRRIFKF